MGPVGPPTARSPAEAIIAFYDLYQRAVSCVTSAVLVGQAYRDASEPFTMSFGGGDARLGRAGAFLLLVRHGYRFLPPNGAHDSWRVLTTNYWYHVADRDERVILAYHWHPVGRSTATSPHLHIGGRTTPVDLSKAHLPTGFVTLPAVIRMTITELGVEPLRTD